MRKYVTGLLAALALNVGVVELTAEEVRLRDDVPNTHTVVKGDTLWGISASFLKNPWLWPEIWHVNAQIQNPHLIYPGDVIRLIYLDGKPRLTLDSTGRIFKLEPKAHVISTGDAIDTIPLGEINSFLSRSRIVDKDEMKLAPYVISGLDQHLIVGAGDKLYARGEVGESSSVYGVYRTGVTFIDPETDEFLGIQALDIGTVSVLTKEDEISTMRVSRTTEEIRIGDRLLREEERSIDSTFIPSAPADDVDGVILAVEGGVSQVGKMDVVVINRGERELIAPGNVLAVYKKGGVVVDRISGDRIKLPDERAGLLMIFRVFEKISLGLVLEADKGLKVDDKVKNP